MPLAPHTENYLYGKGHVLFQAAGQSGLLHLGNVPDFGITVEVTKEDHYSAMYGTKEKDASRVTEKNAKATISLEEFSAENINLAYLGDGVNAATQAAGSLDAVEVTPVADRFVELNVVNPYVTKLTHGTVTGGPFQAGETVTGGTSSATGQVAWVGNGFLELIDVSGAFTAGETVSGGTSSASAAASAIEQVEDVVVTDSATPAVRYVQGTDYSLVRFGGLLRKLSAGSIGTTCFVSAQYGTQTLNSVNALVNSSTQGKLLFVGNPDDGPKWRVDAWKCTLTITGEAKFIQDGISALPMEAEILSDRANHPDSPFFKATQIS